MLKVIAYKTNGDNCMPIEPASSKRDWMDETIHKYAYRCLPMQIANANGWMMTAPSDLIVHWTGGDHKSELTVHYGEPTWEFAASSFGYGIVTFHSGYLFKTISEDQKYDMLVSGPPNHWYEFMAPLSGIVEAYWLNSTFTMNWRLLRPGNFTIHKGDPLIFVTPIPHELPEIDANIVSIEDDPYVLHDYVTWSQRRTQTIAALAHLEQTGQGIHGIDPLNPATQWEGEYFRGKDGNGNRVKDHNTKLRYPPFKRDS